VGLLNVVRLGQIIELGDCGRSAVPYMASATSDSLFPSRRDCTRRGLSPPNECRRFARRPCHHLAVPPG
jgi:hypothetical protein